MNTLTLPPQLWKTLIVVACIAVAYAWMVVSAKRFNRRRRQRRYSDIMLRICMADDDNKLEILGEEAKTFQEMFYEENPVDVNRLYRLLMDCIEKRQSSFRLVNG